MLKKPRQFLRKEKKAGAKSKRRKLRSKTSAMQLFTRWRPRVLNRNRTINRRITPIILILTNNKIRPKLPSQTRPSKAARSQARASSCRCLRASFPLHSSLPQCPCLNPKNRKSPSRSLHPLKKTRATCHWIRS